MPGRYIADKKRAFGTWPILAYLAVRSQGRVPPMRFGLFGSAAARRGSGEFDSAEGFRDFIEYNVEAEALGFHSTFVVEHHFTGFGQVDAQPAHLARCAHPSPAPGHRGDRAALA